MVSLAWRYAQARGHLVRWTGETRPLACPAALEVLTPGGWCEVSLGLARHLWRAGRSDMGAEAAERLVTQSCAELSIADVRRRGLVGRFAGSGLRWALSPPLRMGAPRRMTRTRTDRAEASFLERVGDHAPERLVDDALAGLGRARERHAGIESRSQTFLQAAGLTTTLVLANGALLRGHDRVTGSIASVVLGALVLASAALLVAGVYGLFGSMHTFDRVAPNNIRRSLARARERDPEYARRLQVAAVFLAQRRTGLVADWKVARLKRAMWLLLAGVTLLAVASGALVIDALA